MKTRIFCAVVLLAASTGCAGTLQFASITEAHKHFEKGNYEKVLKLISQAESGKALHPEQHAAMTFLKAQTYDSLGQPERAEALYQYVKEQHPNTQYAYLIR